MQNGKLLFEMNLSDEDDKRIRKKLKFDVKEKRYNYKISVDEFTGDQIYEMVSVINYIWKKYRQRIPISFDLGEFKFSDKLVYVVLESLCYYLIKIMKHDIYIQFDAKHTIWSEGIKFSPLLYLPDEKVFTKKYESDLNLHHFRKLVPNKNEREEDSLSILMQEIYCFLQNNGIKDDVCNQLSEAIIELIGNAGEHGNSECLVDIDITDTEYLKYNDDDSNYYGMNAIVLNYSPTLFYEPLLNKLKEESNLPERYEYVSKAKDYHLSNLNSNYGENDFYTISSFQHKISGNMQKSATGGTGLTMLLRSLAENSDTNYCYMLSGNRVLFFEKNYMLYDDNNLIGFNESQNYLSDIPEVRLLKTIKTFIPGVAYNLNYAIKKEW